MEPIRFHQTMQIKGAIKPPSRILIFCLPMYFVFFFSTKFLSFQKKLNVYKKALVDEYLC